MKYDKCIARSWLLATMVLGCAPTANEKTPGGISTETQADVPPWYDCHAEVNTCNNLLHDADLALLFASAAISADGSIACAALEPPANVACFEDLATIEANVTSAELNLDRAERQIERSYSYLTAACDRANLIGLGQVGILRNADPAFNAMLATSALQSAALFMDAWRKWTLASASLGTAIEIANATGVLSPIVIPRLTPIATAVGFIGITALPVASTCEVTQYASMGSMAVFEVVFGPGPGGGFNPPGPLGPMAPDAVYDPLFGPTTIWQGLPLMNVNFADNLTDSAYEMNSCNREDDCSEWPSSGCVGAHSGPNCSTWRSWREVWFEYRAPAGMATTTTVEFPINCRTSFDCVEGANRGRCTNIDPITGFGRCQVPGGTPICPGPRAYGPFDPERDFEFTEGETTPCLMVATQNASLQYQLGGPPPITCSRATPTGQLAGGLMMPGESSGCRVTFRTDGPPEDVGQVHTKDFTVIQQDSGLHIVQNFRVTWKSEAPPGHCYTYDRFSQDWNYSPSPPECPY